MERALEEVIYRVQTDRKNIGLINAIFEGYEHVAVVRVVDKKNCIMEIYTSSCFSEVAEKIMEALRKEYGVKLDLIEILREPVK